MAIIKKITPTVKPNDFVSQLIAKMEANDIKRWERVKKQFKKAK